MSRTVRRLPVGKSKKFGRIGYYNIVRRFAPSEINVLKEPRRPQAYAHSARRFGIFLFAPEATVTTGPRRGRSWRSLYPHYAPDEPRAHKMSISGPKWVDKENFHSNEIQALITRGWYFHHRYEERRTGPEEWDREYVRVGPDFQWQRLWYVNPEFDADSDDQYRRWKAVHALVHRNGHYKDRHPGRNWRRRQKQDDHQLIRSRLKMALYRELYGSVTVAATGAGS